MCGCRPRPGPRVGFDLVFSDRRETPTEVHIDAHDLAQTLAQLAHDKQGSDIAILDVSKSLGIADYFVIVSARNPRHAQAIGQQLQFEMKRQGRLRLHAAGFGAENRWVLLDFNEVVVHVFLPESRQFYGLEDLWADAPRIPFEPGSGTSSAWPSAVPDSIGGD